MRRPAILWLSLKEFHLNFLLFALSFILLTSTIAAGFFISSASSDMMQVFYNYANRLSPDKDGFLITLNGLRYSSVDIIEDLPFNKIYPEFLGGVDSGDFSGEGNALSEYVISSEYVYDDAIEVVDGITFSEEFNNSEFAWISSRVSVESGLIIGDEILYSVGTEFEITYQIVGIFDANQYNSDIVIPFEPYYRSETSAGRNVDHEVYGILSDSRDYSMVSAKLRERRISPDSILDDNFRSLSLIHALFQAIFIVILFAGIWTFSNICGVIIESRYTFIMKMRVLGMKTSRITFVYTGIISMITLFSFVAVFFLERAFSENIQALAAEMYPGVNSTPVDPHFRFVAAIVISAVILGRTIYGLVHKVNSSNLIGLLEERVDYEGKSMFVHGLQKLRR